MSYQELPETGNLVFSPFSLALVLLMARFGARGQTAAQIEKALRLPETKDDLDDLVPTRRGFFKILKQIGVKLLAFSQAISIMLHENAGRFYL